MVRALGYSQNEFDPTDPGRLCRGRERWIEPFDLEHKPEPCHRIVVSGAVFTDDSARDALRGVQHANVDLATLIANLYPRKDLLAFMEDGHPADIPEGAEGVEAYTGWRAGGMAHEALVRWHRIVNGVKEIRGVLGEDPDSDRVRGFAVLQGGEDQEELANSLFVLVGASCLDSPPARYQPAALPEVLERVQAVLLLHRDKHGPALAVYSREPLAVQEKLDALCEKDGTLLVRFAIPPMLARWDRALAELRAEWSATHSEPFPVPESPEPSHWEPRRRRRRRDRFDAEADLGGDAPSAEGESQEEESADWQDGAPDDAGPAEADPDDLDADLEVAESGADDEGDADEDAPEDDLLEEDDDGDATLDDALLSDDELDELGVVDEDEGPEGER